MSNYPLISVIIPNYNHGKYLEQRIESVLNQTYRDFEVIILDDCSTDNSREVIEKYRGHENISQILYNEQNSGSTFKQWEKGIALAEGEWIWIAESDDYCELTFLEELLKQVDSNNGVNLVFCNSMRFRGNEIMSITDLRHLSKTLDGNNYIGRRMIKGNTIMNASMAVFRKSKYTSIPKDWMGYKFCGDWLFWIYIMQGSEIIEFGKVLNYFRTHDANVSGKALVNGLNEMERIKLWGRLVELKIINEYSCYKLQYSMLNLVLSNNNLSSATKKSIKKVIIHEVGFLRMFKFKCKILFGFY